MVTATNTTPTSGTKVQPQITTAEPKIDSLLNLLKPGKGRHSMSPSDMTVLCGTYASLFSQIKKVHDKLTSKEFETAITHQVGKFLTLSENKTYLGSHIAKPYITVQSDAEEPNKVLLICGRTCKTLTFSKVSDALSIDASEISLPPEDLTKFGAYIEIRREKAANGISGTKILLSLATVAVAVGAVAAHQFEWTQEDVKTAALTGLTTVREGMFAAIDYAEAGVTYAVEHGPGMLKNGTGYIWGGIESGASTAWSYVPPSEAIVGSVKSGFKYCTTGLTNVATTAWEHLPESATIMEWAGNLKFW